MSSKGNKNNTAPAPGASDAMPIKSDDTPKGVTYSVQDLLALAGSSTKIPGDFPDIADIRSVDALAPAMTLPWPDGVEEQEVMSGKYVLSLSQRGFRPARGRGQFEYDRGRGRGVYTNDARRGRGSRFVRLEDDDDARSRRPGRYMPPRERREVEGEPPGFDELNWEYIDPSNNIQGPFPASKMQGWMLENYFPGDLQLRIAGSNAPYIKLHDLLKINGSRPFNKAYDTTAAAIVSSIGKPVEKPADKVTDATTALLELQMFGHVDPMHDPSIRSEPVIKDDPLLRQPVRHPDPLLAPAGQYHPAFIDPFTAAHPYVAPFAGDWSRQQQWQNDAWNAPPQQQRKPVDLLAVLHNEVPYMSLQQQVEQPMPVEQPKQVEQPVPVEQPKPVVAEKQKPAQQPKAKPVEPKAKPVEPKAKPVEKPVIVEIVKPTEPEPKPVEVIIEQPKSKEKPKSVEAVKAMEPKVKPKQVEPVAKPVTKPVEVKIEPKPTELEPGFEQVKSAKKKNEKKAQPVPIEQPTQLYEPMGKPVPTIEVATPAPAVAQKQVDPFPRPTFADHLPQEKAKKVPSLKDVQNEQQAVPVEKKKSFAEIQAEELRKREADKKESEKRAAESRAASATVIAPASTTWSLLVATSTPVTTTPAPAPVPAVAAATAAPVAKTGLRDIMAAQTQSAPAATPATNTYSTVTKKQQAPKQDKQEKEKPQDEEMFWGSPAKETPKEDTLQGSFGGPRVPASFVRWAQKELKSITKSEDTTIIEFLVTLHSSQEVTEYLTHLFGNTPAVRGFANDFFINLQSVLSAPVGGEEQKRKKRGKQQKVSSSLLGFGSAGDTSNLEK